MAGRRRLALGAVAAAVACVAAVMVALAFSSDEKTSTRLTLGVNGQFLFGTLPPETWPPHLDAIKEARIAAVRYDALWDKVEPLPPVNGVHTYNWVHLDTVVGNLAERGIRWLPIVDYSAPWVQRLPGNQFSPPASNEEFATYAQALASRYGRDGDLWEEYPELPEVPVTSFEIWNEPNHEAFWPPEPQPRQYLALYLASRAAIRKVDPEAKVVFGGLTENRPLEFLRAAVGDRRDAGDQIDAVGYHPYGTRNDDVDLVLKRIASMRQTLVDLGMADVPIELTEIGWTTAGPYGAVTDADRAKYLTQLIATLLESSCGVESVIAHTWVSLEQDPTSREHWFGLYHPDVVPTASGSAYRSAVNRALDGEYRRYGPASAPCER